MSVVKMLQRIISERVIIKSGDQTRHSGESAVQTSSHTGNPYSNLLKIENKILSL